MLQAQLLEPLALPFSDGLWDPPSLADVETRVRQLTPGKAPDASGVHAELLRALLAENDDARYVLLCLHELIVDFWRGRTRLQDLRPWCEALLFSLYKGKGDRSDLSNYRGIVLLDVVSKLVSRVINSRLVWVVEQVCGETENGYRKNRGTTDCTFLLRRLLESWRRSRPLAPDGSQDFFSFLWTYRKRLTLFLASPFSSFCLGALVFLTI